MTELGPGTAPTLGPAESDRTSAAWERAPRPSASVRHPGRTWIGVTVCPSSLHRPVFLERPALDPEGHGDDLEGQAGAIARCRRDRQAIDRDSVSIEVDGGDRDLRPVDQRVFVERGECRRPGIVLPSPWVTVVPLTLQVPCSPGISGCVMETTWPTSLPRPRSVVCQDGRTRVAPFRGRHAAKLLRACESPRCAAPGSVSSNPPSAFGWSSGDPERP